MEQKMYFTTPNAACTMESLLALIEGRSAVKWRCTRRNPTDPEKIFKDSFIFVNGPDLTWEHCIVSGAIYLKPGEFVEKCAELAPKTKRMGNVMTMTPKEETAFESGFQMALRHVIKYCLSRIGSDGTKPHAHLVVEMNETRSKVRDLCEKFGDTDYPDDLYLPDIVEKHLGRHLHDKLG